MSIYGPRIPVVSNDTTEIRVELRRMTQDCGEDCNPTTADVALSGSYKLSLVLISDAPPPAIDLFSYKLENSRVYFKLDGALADQQPGRYTASMLQGTELLSEFQLQLSRAGDYAVDVTTSVA